MIADRMKDNHNDLIGLVSVIVPTKNSSKTIAECLLSVKEQTYRDIEVIVIDANSTDETPQICSKYEAQVISLESERAKAKNFGAAKSAGEFVLFMDSDMVLEPQVIEDCIKVFSSECTTGGVIIPERSIGSGFWVKVRDFERSLYAGSRIESARFFKKTYVEQVGGFDEDLVFFEESTLPQKIESVGLNVNARISSFILHNEAGFNLRKWLRKKRYYADSFRVYRNRYARYAQLQTSISYRISVFLSNGKWKLLLKHPTLTFGLFTLKGLEFIFSKLG